MDDGYKTCAFCGKRFDLFRHVTNPSFWGYRWGQTYFCSWKCLRAKEKKMEGNGGPADMARKLTLEQKKKAVQIAIDGGNPVDYLKECGSDAPDKTWWFIKNKLKDANPELYAQIPDRRAKRTITAPASTLSTEPAAKKEQTKAETINKAMEQPEPMATKPGVKISITAVSSGKFVFIKNTNGIIIENRERNQTLTLEQEDIKGLVEALPIIVGMFKA